MPEHGGRPRPAGRASLRVSVGVSKCEGLARIIRTHVTSAVSQWIFAGKPTALVFNPPAVHRHRYFHLPGTRLNVTHTQHLHPPPTHLHLCPTCLRRTCTTTVAAPASVDPKSLASTPPPALDRSSPIVTMAPTFASAAAASSANPPRPDSSGEW
jgi:hypothetical protein